MQPDDVIPFIRQKDYVFVRELGQGACGRTVLLRDDVIGEQYVCKKYHPADGLDRRDLFDNFVREIKLLHRVHHPNVVRVFNHFIYPDKYAGFLLMEFVDGCSIDEFLGKHPEKINEVFAQAVTGFLHLETSQILHRDIRPHNLLVSDDGVVKVIDLGFGKHAETTADFDKSVSLNWWCTPPQEFATGVYDFQSEVYFLGKLFERIIHENEIEQFQYRDILERMCQPNPSMRVGRFEDVEKSITDRKFVEIEFADWETTYYRTFAGELIGCISNIRDNAPYVSDLQRLVKRLEDAYQSFLLEEYVPDVTKVISCFVDGSYTYWTNRQMTVEAVKSFLQLLKGVGPEKRNLILANLQTRLDTVSRSHENAVDPDDIPF